MKFLGRFAGVLFAAGLLVACGPTSSGRDMGAGDGGTEDGEDLDGDGFSGDADCNEGNADVHEGAPESCNGLDDDCDNLVDEDWDLDMDGSASCNGDCNDNDGSVRPGIGERCDGVDTDCNAATDENADLDGDGYSLCDGECDDQQVLVNPGAVEVAVKADGTPEGVDNDCDGLIDEPLEACDMTLDPADPLSYAKAIEMCGPWVASATFAAGDVNARGIRGDYGTYVPNWGSSFTVLSSGLVADANDPGYVNPQPGTAFNNTAAHPAPMGAIGCSSADPATVNDYIELRLEIDVPSNARSFSYDFNFMSAEYPEWVCSSYDDTFIAYLNSSAFTGNISFDSVGNPVSVNIGFFTVCDGGTGCTGGAPLAGTGYEGGTGGGTGWLTTTAPVTGGEHITLRFIIFDEGDWILDSAVLIDNLRWEAEPVDGPVTIPRVTR
jgi:hypothetical protein